MCATFFIQYSSESFYFIDGIKMHNYILVIIIGLFFSISSPSIFYKKNPSFLSWFMMRIFPGICLGFTFGVSFIFFKKLFYS